MTTKKIIHKITENWKEKVICILIALGFFLVYQRASFVTSEYKLPLQIKNSGNLVFMNNLPNPIELKVTGSQNEIGALQRKYFEVYIDLSEYAEPGIYKVPIHLKISEDAPILQNVEFDLKPDFAELNLEESLTTLVPLKVNTYGECAKGYEVTSVEINPNVVQITGITSLISKTASLQTSVVNLSEKSSDFTQKVEVLNQNKRILLTGQKEFNVSVKIKPIKATKKIESSVIFFYGLKDSLSIENSTIPYSLTISGNKNELDKFVLSPLSVQVDCSSIESSGTYDLPLSVILPDGITLEKIEPEVVHVTVVDFVEIPMPEDNEKNADESATTTTEEQKEESQTEDNLSLPITE